MKMIKRIMSVLMVLILVALFVAVFVTGISGSKYFPVALLMCVLIPVLFYGMSLMTKVLSRKGEKLEKEVADAEAEQGSDANNVEK